MDTFLVDNVLSFRNYLPKLYSVEYPLKPDDQFSIQLRFNDKTFQFKKGTCFIMKRIHGHPFKDGQWVGCKEEYQFFKYDSYVFGNGCPPTALVAKVYNFDKKRFSTNCSKISFDDLSLFIDTLQILSFQPDPGYFADILDYMNS